MSFSEPSRGSSRNSAAASPRSPIFLDELPAGTAWTYAPSPGYRLLSDSTIVVDGLRARVLEYEATEVYGPIRPGDRHTNYVTELGDDRFLTARTTNQRTTTQRDWSSRT